jgi:radical SAM superfamily enzyme YgiQ (UPF0313 family)
VLGGPHPTLLPAEASAHADAIVIGEAEESWPRLIDDFRRGRLQPCYRAQRPPSLLHLPHARRDLLEGRWYSKGVLIATRGCPNSCEYCTLPHLYQRTLRFRPVDEVAEEVASIKGKPLVFWDDNLAADPRYAKALFRAITPYKKWWTAQATIQIAEDEELLRLAAESGCKAFFLGLESFSQASLDGTNKSFNRAKDYRELVARLHGYGIAVQAGIMLGFDQDGPDVFERTLEAATQIGIDNATVSLVVPFPGTRLFARLEGEGRILTRDWSRYNGKTDVVFRPKLMTPDMLQAGFEWARREFYSWGSIWSRLARSRMERAPQRRLSSCGLSAWRRRLQSGRGSLKFRTAVPTRSAVEDRCLHPPNQSPMADLTTNCPIERRLSHSLVGFAGGDPRTPDLAHDVGGAGNLCQLGRQAG